MKDHQIFEPEITSRNLYSNRHCGDIQPIINVICDSYELQIKALHDSYRSILADLRHKLARKTAEAKSMRVSIDTHNQKMLGNAEVKE